MADKTFGYNLYIVVKHFDVLNLFVLKSEEILRFYKGPRVCNFFKRSNYETIFIRRRNDSRR